MRLASSGPTPGSCAKSSAEAWLISMDAGGSCAGFLFCPVCPLISSIDAVIIFVLGWPAIAPSESTARQATPAGTRFLCKCISRRTGILPVRFESVILQSTGGPQRRTWGSRPVLHASSPSPCQPSRRALSCQPQHGAKQFLVKRNRAGKIPAQRAEMAADNLPIAARCRAG